MSPEPITETVKLQIYVSKCIYTKDLFSSVGGFISTLNNSKNIFTYKINQHSKKHFPVHENTNPVYF